MVNPVRVGLERGISIMWEELPTIIVACIVVFVVAKFFLEDENPGTAGFVALLLIIIIGTCLISASPL